MRLTRRKFLTGLAALAATPALAGLYTWKLEPHWLDFVHRDLPIRNLPAGLNGKRLVQLSDIHIGRQVSDAYLTNSFRRVAALHPDIVVHTGDLVSYEGPHQTAQFERVMRHFPRGRLATAAVLGNHDYGVAWSELAVADRIERLLTGAGATVLRNRRINVAGLDIVGLDDFWSPCFNPGPELETINAAGPTLVLCHNPDVCDLPVWGRFSGWILAGHTHGGQCKPPFLPPPLLPVKNRRYTSGDFSLEGGRRLYINRGLGHLEQVRFNARPEITVFRLVRA
jgi:predicted MPP superfamily phosphohydrolase